MPENDNARKEVLPYDSGLFGVYQTILGWKGNQAKGRVALEQVESVQKIIQSMIHDGILQANLQGSDPRVLRPDTEIVFRPPDWMNPEVAKYIRENIVTTFKEGGSAGEPQSPEKKFNRRVHSYFATGSLPDRGDADLDEPGAESSLSTPVKEEPQKPGKNLIPDIVTELAGAVKKRRFENNANAAITAGVLNWLYDTDPSVLNNVCFASKQKWEIQKNFVNPIAGFDYKTQMSVLSPVGILYLFRQFFFELETFLGTPEGHVWVNAGGTAELEEVEPDDSIAQNSYSLAEPDDILELVAENNRNSLQYALNECDSEEWVTCQADVTAEISYERNSRLSRETAYKQLRQNIEKLSRELRRKSRKSFRAATGTGSKRYMVENTGNKLVNYELRRKMKKVGIKVQPIGIQMCWQLYINDPAGRLNIPDLVYIPAPEEAKSDLQVSCFYEEYKKAISEANKHAGSFRRRSSAELRQEEKRLIYRYLFQQIMGSEPSQSKYVADEILRSLFDIDKIFFFVAPDWWLPRDRSIQATQLSAQSGNAPAEESAGSNVIGPGWLIQQNADNHRNALINSPWAKVVIPIRTGKEIAVLKWLQQDHIEGSDGLDDPYQGEDPELKGKTIGQALDLLAEKVMDSTVKINTAGYALQETGFGSGPACTDTDDPIEPVGQWIVSIPTNQVVAVEYDTNQKA